MKQIREVYKKTGRLHHAYGVFGDKEKIKDELVTFLTQDLKFPVNDNPDFWQGEFNVLKVEDSLNINKNHLILPVKYERKVFVVYTNFITRNAQNSLLKIFEEPRADTVFFLILPSASDLLPTLKSRLIISQKSSSQKKKNESKLNINVEEFLQSNLGERLSVIAKIIKDIKEEKITKSDAINFLKNLENFIQANSKSGNSGMKKNKNLLAMEDIEKAISYASDESPSMKVILEHLAMVL